MPFFNVHVPKDLFSLDQRKAIADALAHSLQASFGLPPEDKFVVINEHAEGYLFLHPTYGDVDRSAGAIIISVHIPASRPMSQKRALLKEIVQRLHDNVGIRPDDVFVTLIPLPSENFSFGRGVSPFDKGDD
ncbi:tautomerase family protein [Sphingomonas sp. CFBP 8765]|uniref:tautomerase family protein n=1 Tax=Sphingomonas sp. CFBP 8765 TaxID=2775274 RepID=UPI0017870056|nr:tautomerase family protein [Sphingomonas sp. CFBP 8765]MBD8472063.1 tautomerase family protein [Sphingomonas sp. CFBP 8765]